MLSPTLFIITIDDLIEILESNRKIPFVFADDLSTVQLGVKEARESIKLIE